MEAGGGKSNRVTIAAKAAQREFQAQRSLADSAGAYLMKVPTPRRTCISAMTTRQPPPLRSVARSILSECVSPGSEGSQASRPNGPFLTSARRGWQHFYLGRYQSHLASAVALGSPIISPLSIINERYSSQALAELSFYWNERRVWNMGGASCIARGAIRGSTDSVMIL